MSAIRQCHNCEFFTFEPGALNAGPGMEMEIYCLRDHYRIQTGEDPEVVRNDGAPKDEQNQDPDYRDALKLKNWYFSP